MRIGLLPILVCTGLIELTSQRSLLFSLLTPIATRFHTTARIFTKAHCIKGQATTYEYRKPTKELTANMSRSRSHSRSPSPTKTADIHVLTENLFRAMEEFTQGTNTLEHMVDELANLLPVLMLDELDELIRRCEALIEKIDEGEEKEGVERMEKENAESGDGDE
jgi:hypothetical protein